MADLNARDAKLVQYLNEAYGKEKQLETALTAHIQMAQGRAPYKRKLQAHLKETKQHARGVSRRIKELGGKTDGAALPDPVPEAAAGAVHAVTSLAQRGAAAAQGPLHMVRGTGEAEKLLKNAKTEYQDEAEEIATYTAIETLAEAVGDKETAKLAKGIRREEERMAKYLAGLIPQLTKSVVTSEIPAKERRTNGGRRRRSSSRRSSSSSGRRTSSSSRSRSSSSRSGGRSKSSSSRSGSGQKTASRSGSARKTSASRSGSARKTSASRSRSGGSSRSGSSRTRASSRSRSGTSSRRSS